MLMSSAFLSHHGTGRNEGSGHTVTVVQELRRRREHCIAPFSPLRSSTSSVFWGVALPVTRFGVLWTLGVSLVRKSQIVRRSAVWIKSCSRISLSPPLAHVALLDSY